MQKTENVVEFNELVSLTVCHDITELLLKVALNTILP
jgi:hypothetical protein